MPGPIIRNGSCFRICASEEEILQLLKTGELLPSDEIWDACSHYLRRLDDPLRREFDLDSALASDDERLQLILHENQQVAFESWSVIRQHKTLPPTCKIWDLELGFVPASHPLLRAFLGF